MSGLQLIELAEKRGLLDPQVVNDLRQKLRAKGDSVTAKEVAQHLVKRGRLTQFQADGLLDNVRLVAEAAAEGVDLLGDTEDAIEVSELELIDEAEAATLTPLEAEPIRTGPPPLASTAEAVDDLAAALNPDTAAAVPTADVDKAKAVVQPGPGEVPADQPSRSLKSLFVRQQGWRQRKRGGPSMIMLGAGALVLLSVLGLFLFFFLTRETGDEYFQAAEQDYQAESYENAIKKYDLFTAKFRKHPKYSLAMVRSQLARMRQPVQAGNWDRAWQAVGRGLSAIQDEPAFDQAAPELAGVLPAIYAGFAHRAAATESIEEKQQQVDLAAEVLALIKKPEVLPGSQRRAIELRLREVQKDLDVVERTIARQRGLEAAISAIQDAVGQRDTVKAYALHKQLLSRFPGLRANQQLATVVRSIAEREKDAVVVSDGRAQATTEDDRSPGGQRVLLAKRRLQAKTDATGQLFSFANGALYGLAADNGRVLWRRHIGLAAVGMPGTLGSGDGQDVLITDRQKQHVLRLDGDNGQLVWRLALDEPVTDPVVALDRVYVSLASGKLLSIDPLTGNVLRVASLPQPLYSPPQVDAARGVLYLAGNHSSVFVFDAESLECLGVYATGHPEGSLVVAPIVVGNHLLLAERSGTDFTRLIPLARNDNGLIRAADSWPEAVRIEGHVSSAVPISENAVLLATRAGAAFIVASEGRTRSGDIRIAARSPVTSSSPAPFFGLPLGDTVLLAGRGLERFEYQPANGTLVSRWALAEPSLHVAAPERRGNTLFVQYKRPTSQAVRVAALAIDDQQAQPQAQWSVDLGSAPAGPPMVDKRSRSIVVVSRDSGAWELGSRSFQSGRQDEAAADLPGRTQFLGGEPLGEGARFFAATDQGSGYLIYDSAQPGTHLLRRDVRLPAQQLACRLVAAGDELIACTRSGLVYLIDPLSGKPAGTPFQPKLRLGAQVNWLPPAHLADERIVVGTAGGKFRLLKREAGDAPRLTSVVSRIHDGQYVGGMMAAADHVVVTRRRGHQHELVFLRAADLECVAAVPLEGTLAAGPFLVDTLVVCATDDKRLLAFSAQGQPVWSVPLPAGPLAGAPVAAGDTWFCADVNGHVWRLDADSGQPRKWSAGSDDELHYLGEPLGSRPVLTSSRLFVLGRDCTLLMVALP